jgi:hypothetical protein
MDRRDRPAMQAFLAALRDEALQRRIRALHLQPHEGKLTNPPVSEALSAGHEAQTAFVIPGSLG